MEELSRIYDLQLFTNCLKQASDSGTETEKEINNIALQSMEQDATEHGVQFTRVALSNLVNAEDEKDVLKEVNGKDLVREAAGLLYRRREPQTLMTKRKTNQRKSIAWRRN